MRTRAATRRGRPAPAVAQYFNTAAFAPAAPGTFGSVGRNTLRGPAYADIDASVFKDFSFSDRWRPAIPRRGVQCAESRELPEFNSTVLAGVTFNRITSALDPRVLQFALKLFF